MERLEPPTTTRMVSILEPVADPSPTVGELAERPASLRGRTVGLLDNGQVNAGIFLGHVAELLAERLGAAAVVQQRKDFWTKQAPAELIEDLATVCDVVVTGWGS